MSAAMADPARSSLYVTARDGVRIAVDLWLPSDLPGGARIGAVVRATRYHRDRDSSGRRCLDEARRWAGWGYALVLVDARGSGASFGSRSAELSEAEIRDYGDVLDWIAAQPWSNGRAGAYGGSYEGNTAELMASLGNEHLRAVAPLFPDYDLYEDLIMPGGVKNRLMADSWFHFTRALDGIDGAAAEMEALAADGMEFAVEAVAATPVDGPDGPALRDAAVREHQASADMRGAVARTPFKDDETPGWSWVARSSFAQRAATERAGVPMLTAAGWFDAGTAAGALDRFVSLDVPQEAYVGAWNHGATFTTDPFAPPDQRTAFEEEALLERVRDFFDRYVQRGEEPRPGRTLHYYTLARGDWRTTAEWPLPGTATERWFMRAGGELARSAPLDPQAADRFRPDPRASTGAQSRWGTQVSGGGNVVYPDRAEADRRLLTWTGPPLERDTHVAGTVVVELQLSSTREDGTLVAYLEDVAPDGRVTHVTEGHLRLASRALAADDAPHRALRTPRSFARADAAAMTPGTVEAVRFDLLPTSVLLRAGHRVRIALGGTDAAHFELLPADGDVEYAVHREAARPSFVDLPVAPA